MSKHRKYIIVVKKTSSNDVTALMYCYHVRRVIDYDIFIYALLTSHQSVLHNDRSIASGRI
jgi:hypothetical protein